MADNLLDRRSDQPSGNMLGGMPSYGGTLDPFQSRVPGGWEYMAYALPYLAGTRALATAAPKIAQGVSGAEGAAGWGLIPAHVYDQISKLREGVSQAWHNGLMSSADREQARIDALRHQYAQAYQEDPEGVLAQAKSYLQWEPDTPGGRAARGEYIRGLPYDVLNKVYAQLYPMPEDNAPNTTLVSKTPQAPSWAPRTVPGEQ